MRLAAILVLSSVGLAVAAPRIKPKEPNDRVRLVGDWAPDEGKPGGINIYTFRFREDGTCALVQNGAAERPATYVLDPQANPPVMTWKNNDHDPVKCRYVFDGDRLTLGFYNGDDPPKSLEPGSANLALYYLKRVKE